MRCKQSRLRCQLLWVWFVVFDIIVCILILLSIRLINLRGNDKLIKALKWLYRLHILSILANLDIQMHSFSFIITERLLLLLYSRSRFYLIKCLQALNTVEVLQWLKLIESIYFLVQFLPGSSLSCHHRQILGGQFSLASSSSRVLALVYSEPLVIDLFALLLRARCILARGKNQVPWGIYGGLSVVAAAIREVVPRQDWYRYCIVDLTLQLDLPSVLLLLDGHDQIIELRVVASSSHASPW